MAKRKIKNEKRKFANMVKIAYSNAQAAIAAAYYNNGFSPLKQADINALVNERKAAKDFEGALEITSIVDSNLSQLNQGNARGFLLAGLITPETFCKDLPAKHRGIASAALDLHDKAQAALKELQSRQPSTPATPPAKPAK